MAAIIAAAGVLGLVSQAVGADGRSGALLHNEAAFCCSAPVGDGIAEAPEAAPAPGWAEAAVTVAQSGGSGEPDSPRIIEDVPPQENDDGSDTSRGSPLRELEETSSSFEGSAKPEGPDLTLPQERQLISSGWK